MWQLLFNTFLSLPDTHTVFFLTLFTNSYSRTTYIHLENALRALKYSKYAFLIGSILTYKYNKLLDNSWVDCMLNFSIFFILVFGLFAWFACFTATYYFSVSLAYFPADYTLSQQRKLLDWPCRRSIGLCARIFGYCFVFFHLPLCLLAKESRVML